MSPSRAGLRSVAGLGAAALVAASLSLVGAGAAQAATTDYTLQWGVSQYLNEHVTAQAFTGGASEEAATGIVTFTDGVSRRDASGTTSVEYQGDARYAFNHPVSGAELYAVTFSDPTIVTDADGDGRIVADVTWSVTGSGSGTLADTTVAGFSSAHASWSGYDLTATPNWEGVAPVDAYGTGKPTDGKSWDVALVNALPSSLSPFFYASGSGNDFKKFPAEFTAEVAPAVTVTSSTFAPTQVAFTLAGSRFNGFTNPGDNGVYVGLAPAGGLPDVGSQAGMSSFAAANWVMASQIADGSFTTVLNTTPDKLKPGTSYSVYTWQAHTHSNTTQDTETPVTIDWAALKPAASTVTVGGATGTTYGKSAVVTAAVPAAGTVTLTGLGAQQSQTLTAAGAASFTVPATLAAGSYTATFAYGGNGTSSAAQATATFTVTKATSKTAVKVSKKPTAKKAGQAAVTVTGAAAGAKVAVTVKGAGKSVKKTVTVNASGKAVVALKKAAKGGAFTVTASYAGDANHAASTGKATYKVAKAKKAKKAKKK